MMHEEEVLHETLTIFRQLDYNHTQVDKGR